MSSANRTHPIDWQEDGYEGLKIMKCIALVTLALIITAGPAHAAMEPEEIGVRLAIGLAVPPAYRGWRPVPRPNHWQTTPARERRALKGWEGQR